MHFERIILGSGPTGISASKYFVQNQLHVTMIDAGFELPDKHQEIKEKLRNSLNQNPSTFISFKGIPVALDSRLKHHPGSKNVFGSSFPYAEASFNQELGFDTRLIAPRNSLAKGGLSNVWGSICFRYPKVDLLDLHAAPSDIDYSFIESFIPISGNNDDLSSIYGGPTDFEELVYKSPLHFYIKTRYEKCRLKLNEKGIFLGDTRVAVSNSGRNKCRKCGLCSVGCPWDLIWNSSVELEKLKINKHFKYIKDIVTQIRRSADTKYLILETKSGSIITCSELFLACGPIGTSALLSVSKLIPEETFLDDTQLTLLPFFLKLRQRNSDVGFTLSKLSVVKLKKKSKNIDFFAQVTGYTVDSALRAKGFSPLLKNIPNSALDRLFSWIGVAMIFHPAKVSGRIAISRMDSGFVVFQPIKAEKNKRLRQTFNNLKLSIILFRLGTLPLPLFAQNVRVGESYHIGRLHDSRGQDLFDADGKLISEPRIKVLDSSSLSSILSGPITLTSMANAVRIVRVSTRESI